MSFINPNLFDHSIVSSDAASLPYENRLLYIPVPMVSSEAELFPAIFYAVYPFDEVLHESHGKENFWQRSGELNFIPQECCSSVLLSEYSCEHCDPVSSNICEETLVKPNYHENKLKKDAHVVSSSFYEVSGVERKDLSTNSDVGSFGSDGCWYPSSSSTNSFDSLKQTLESDAEITETNSVSGIDFKEDDLALTPPSKLVMPKNLMPFYNCYQRLDLPSSALGRPHLIHTFAEDGNLSVEDLWRAHMKLLFRNLPHQWNLHSSRPSAEPESNWNTFKDLAKVRFYCQVITNLYYDIASRIYCLRTPQQIRTRRLGQPVSQHNKYLCQGCSHGLCKPTLKSQNNAVLEEQFSEEFQMDYSPSRSSGAHSDPSLLISENTSGSYPKHWKSASSSVSGLFPPQPNVLTSVCCDSSYQQVPYNVDLTSMNLLPQIPIFFPVPNF